MTAIGKGDFVECIDASDAGHVPIGFVCTRRLAPDEVLTLGAVYQVERVWMANLVGHEVPVVELRGVRRHADCVELYGGHAYAAALFRPISGGQTGMFDHMLKAPADAPTREPVAA